MFQAASGECLHFTLETVDANSVPYGFANIRYTQAFCSEMKLCAKSIRSWCDGSLDRSFMVYPLSYFLFQSVLNNWCNKGCGMCYPVCGMMHIKEPLLLIGKSSPCSGSIRFHFSLSEWSFTICLMPYNHK